MLLMGLQLQAQNHEQYDSAKNKTLQEVIIQSLRSKKSELTSPVPVQSLSGIELRRLNSLSVADALRFFSGVQLRDYGGIGGIKTLDVRSMGVNHSTVFYDGLKIGNAQNGQIDLGQFSLVNLEKISLYNAQNNTLLIPAEAYASGATLFLETKKPLFKNREKTHLQSGIKIGSFGLINPSFSFQQKLSQTLSGIISGEWISANGEYPFRYKNNFYDTTAIRKNAGIESFRIEATLLNKMRDSSEWILKFYNYHSKRGLPGAVVANHFENYQTLWNDNLFIQSVYHKKWNPKFESKVRFKFSSDHTRYLDPTFANQAGKLDNKYDEKSYYVSLSNEYRLDSNWSFAFSTDYKSSEMKANLNQFAYPTRNTWLWALTTQWKNNRITIQGNLLGTRVNEYTKESYNHTSFNQYSPALSFSWKPLPNDNWRIRGFYKNIFRMPTFNDLYYTLIGNAKLKPEYVTQFNLGLTYSALVSRASTTLLSFTVDAYKNFVKDKIVALPNNTLFRWSMMNMGKVEITGVDFAGHLDILFGELSVAVGLNYTFQNALDAEPNSYTYKNRVPYVPQHYATFTTGFNWNQFNLNYSFIYTGERYNRPAAIPDNLLPSWVTHDVSLGKKWNLKNSQISLSGEILNIGNQFYDVILNYPMPGRNYRISLNYEF